MRDRDCLNDWTGGTWWLWWPQRELLLVMVAVMVSSASTEVHPTVLPLLPLDE